MELFNNSPGSPHACTDVLRSLVRERPSEVAATGTLAQTPCSPLSLARQRSRRRPLSSRSLAPLSSPRRTNAPDGEEISHSLLTDATAARNLRVRVTPVVVTTGTG